MKFEKTNRGFDFTNFTDRNGVECSIQKSSLAFEDTIWFGVQKANPQILASKLQPGLTGWVKYPIPEGVSFTTRMHLSREQVSAIIPVLQKFVDTGDLS